MAAAGYSASTGSVCALAAATAKSILGIQSNAAHGLNLKSFWVAFDGVTASAVPVLVEVCQVTWATQPPGTLSTAVTLVQKYGRAIAAASTFRAARDWTTTQPTVITPIEEFLLTPNAGLVGFQWPLGSEPDCVESQGFVIRCTAPAVVNVRASATVERI